MFCGFEKLFEELIDNNFFVYDKICLKWFKEKSDGLEIMIILF